MKEIETGLRVLIKRMNNTQIIAWAAQALRFPHPLNALETSTGHAQTQEIMYTKS
jgi:hypothetical protein